MARRSYKKLAAAPDKLDADKSNGNASLCTECGVCVEKCPQEIDIPGELKKVKAVFSDRKKIEEVYVRQAQ